MVRKRQMLPNETRLPYVTIQTRYRLMADEIYITRYQHQFRKVKTVCSNIIDSVEYRKSKTNYLCNPTTQIVESYCFHFLADLLISLEFLQIQKSYFYVNIVNKQTKMKQNYTKSFNPGAQSW